MATRVRDIMTPDPTCCVRNELVQRAAQIMRDENVGSVPIISDPERRGLIGTLTDRDLAIRVIAEGRDINTTTVGDVMTTGLITCSPDDDADEVMDRMARNQIRRIPVIDQDNRVVGIVAQADVATRLERPSKLGEVVESISQPTDIDDAG